MGENNTGEVINFCLENLALKIKEGRFVLEHGSHKSIVSSLSKEYGMPKEVADGLVVMVFDYLISKGYAAAKDSLMTIDPRYEDPVFYPDNALGRDRAAMMHQNSWSTPVILVRDVGGIEKLLSDTSFRESAIKDIAARNQRKMNTLLSYAPLTYSCQPKPNAYIHQTP